MLVNRQDKTAMKRRTTATVNSQLKADNDNRLKGTDKQLHKANKVKGEPSSKANKLKGKQSERLAKGRPKLRTFEHALMRMFHIMLPLLFLSSGKMALWSALPLLWASLKLRGR